MTDTNRGVIFVPIINPKAGMLIDRYVYPENIQALALLTTAPALPADGQLSHIMTHRLHTR
jgi:hypothetical protein